MSEKTLKRYKRALWREELTIIQNFMHEVQRLSFGRRFGIAWDVLFPPKNKRTKKGKKHA